MCWVRSYLTDDCGLSHSAKDPGVQRRILSDTIWERPRARLPCQAWAPSAKRILKKFAQNRNFQDQLMSSFMVILTKEPVCARLSNSGRWQAPSRGQNSSRQLWSKGLRWEPSVRFETLETVNQGHRIPGPQGRDTTLRPSFPSISYTVSTGGFLTAFIVEVRGRTSSPPEANGPTLSVMRERDTAHNIQHTARRGGYREQL